MDKIPLNGLDFIEFAGPEPKALHRLFEKMGFCLSARCKTKDISLYRQGDCLFVLNAEKNSFSADFSKARGGACVPSMGWRVGIPAQKAFDLAIARGAKAAKKDSLSYSFPAVCGVGGSLIYFVDTPQKEDIKRPAFEGFSAPKGLEQAWKKTNSLSAFAKSKEEALQAHPPSTKLLNIDHLTHNVPVGGMDHWCEFYSRVFGFTERRYFDIQGLKTGLVSKVMRSPCSSITIPINEPSDNEKGKKSQIQEYLEEYNGAGIQHIALSTKDIISSVSTLREKGIAFLETPDSYYEVLKARLPVIKEDIRALQKQKILADGDKKGYLLQIFTQNVIGPVFFEIIERHGHDGFGEGNFQALFDAIERDQMKRGYL